MAGIARLTATVLAGLAAALPAAITAASGTAGSAPVLALPIDCQPGRSCFVQQLFDHDPGPAARDFRCGSRTYDGHDGTDIRLPSLAAMRRGVAVLAAAPGVVLAVRDGEPDHQVASPADRAAIRGRECGNGVVIAHAGGWQTQYCHMQRGSVTVRQGQSVGTGDRLGLVGVSGDSQFPHVHLSVRQDHRKVDPYAPALGESQCGAGGGRPLWSATAARALAWRGSEVINAGFAGAPVTMADIDEEQVATPSARATALVFWARAIGLEAGDSVLLRLTGPDGQTLSENATRIDHPMAQWLGLSGRRTPPQGWPAGRYSGTMTITRNGAVVASRSERLAI